MRAKKNSESEVKVNVVPIEQALLEDIAALHKRVKALEERVIALERGLEAVLSKMEASGQADDEPGWYGRPE